MNIFNKLKSLFCKTELQFSENLWKTENCYKCGKPYNKNDFWTIFQRIGNTVWQVPICNDCAGNGKNVAPTNNA